VLYAFLDTTALHRAYLLRGPQWDSVAQAILFGVAKVAVSDVTLLELRRQAVDDARDVEKRLKALAEDVSRFGRELQLPDLAVRPSDWLTEFKSRLQSRGIEVAHLAEPSHADIVDRDLRRLPPFKPSGEGYRDALIWLTFLEWMRALEPTPDDTVLFVSNNTRQFARQGSEELSPVLRKEARDSGFENVELVADRLRFVTLIRELSREASQASMPDTPTLGEEAIEREVRSKIEQLAGAQFEIMGRLELNGVPVTNEFDLPDAFETSVVWAEPIGGIVDTFAVDSFDETTELWEAATEAVLWVEGRMERQDLDQLPPTARVFHWEWREETLLDVEFPVAVRLRFDVRLERAGASSAELVGAAVLPEERWRWEVERATDGTLWDPF
jgi:hypothetical protein